MPPIWPLLLLACALCSFWNWRAALAFASCVIIVRASLHFGLNNVQLWFMMLYSVTAFATLFFVDRVAGGFLAIIGAVFCLSLLGVIEPRTKIILSEIAIVTGLLASAWAGPSGGLLNPSGIYRTAGGFVDDGRMAGNGRFPVRSEGD